MGKEREGPNRGAIRPCKTDHRGKYRIDDPRCMYHKVQDYNKRMHVLVR
jgi:hypothetical protein